MDNCNENVIEWLKDEQRATVTLSQRRTITRVRRLAEKYPEECRITAENKDGSIVAHIPVSWVKISPLKKLTKSQIEAAQKNIQKATVSKRNLTNF